MNCAPYAHVTSKGIWNCLTPAYSTCFSGLDPENFRQMKTRLYIQSYSWNLRKHDHLWVVFLGSCFSFFRTQLRNFPLIYAKHGPFLSRAFTNNFISLISSGGKMFFSLSTKRLLINLTFCQMSRFSLYSNLVVCFVSAISYVQEARLYGEALLSSSLPFLSSHK